MHAQSISGRVDRASATEAVVSGSIPLPGRVKLNWWYGGGGLVVCFTVGVHAFDAKADIICD